MESGYCESVCASILSMYVLTPFDIDNIKAIPIIPIDPAKATSMVLAFLVQRLLKLRARAVKKLMEAFPRFLWTGLMPA